MGYNIAVRVKVEGCNKYAIIAEPELANPTYNIGTILRKCMDWNFSQSEKCENGEYITCYYRCDKIITKIEKGIRELRTNSNKYKKFEPSNGWGMRTALESLESLRDCIYECADDIPLNCLYMSW